MGEQSEQTDGDAIYVTVQECDEPAEALYCAAALKGAQTAA